MWTVVYIATNKENANIIKTRLEEEGILVQIRPIGMASVETNNHEIMVPESEVHEAHEILDLIVLADNREG